MKQRAVPGAFPHRLWLPAVQRKELRTLRSIRQSCPGSFGQPLESRWRSGKNRKRSRSQFKALAQAHTGELKQKMDDFYSMKPTPERRAGCCHVDDRPDCPTLKTLAREQRRCAGAGAVAPQCVQRKTALRQRSLRQALTLQRWQGLYFWLGSTTWMFHGALRAKLSRKQTGIVKTFRILLIVLLAVLLPSRGALAAAMVCAPVGGEAHAEVSPHEHSTRHGATTIENHDHAQHEMHAHASGSEHESLPSASDASGTCNFCCDFCSLTPLVSSFPNLVAPQVLSSVSFPDIPAPFLSFVSEGQERPPRTI